MENKIIYKLQYILNPVFLVCLILLLLNDFWFKSQLDNWFTGKLSDFTGIAVFVLFFSVFFKSKKYVFIVSGVLFAIWKSEFSQAFIDFWNQMTMFPIDRVIDYSDLFCLLILIPLFYFEPKKVVFPSNFIKKMAVYPLFILTVLSITATSRKRMYLPPNDIHIDKTVKVKLDKTIFFEKLTAKSVSHSLDTIIKFEKYTIEKYILENIIIAKDTFLETKIAIEEKKRKLIVNIENVKLPKKSDPQSLTDYSMIKILSKDYGNKIANYLKELD